jgi:hypothetical protein
MMAAMGAVGLCAGGDVLMVIGGGTKAAACSFDATRPLNCRSSLPDVILASPRM